MPDPARYALLEAPAGTAERSDVVSLFITFIAFIGEGR